jgi:D-alanine-D-alanine ligase-like ATP-grasp enzyme
MTATSLLPKIAGLAGMGFPELIEEILRLTVEGRQRIAGGR